MKIIHDKDPCIWNESVERWFFNLPSSTFEWFQCTRNENTKCEGWVRRAFSEWFMGRTVENDGFYWARATLFPFVFETSSVDSEQKWLMFCDDASVGGRGKEFTADIAGRFQYDGRLDRTHTTLWLWCGLIFHLLIVMTIIIIIICEMNREERKIETFGKMVAKTTCISSSMSLQLYIRITYLSVITSHGAVHRQYIHFLFLLYTQISIPLHFFGALSTMPKPIKS